MATMRGPSVFTVVSVDLKNGDNSVECGHFDTIDEARGCVEYDGLTEWEIWRGDTIVEEPGPSVPVVKCPRCSTSTRGLGPMGCCDSCAEG